MVLFLRSMSILTGRGDMRTSTINVTMLGIIISLFCLVTAHVGIAIARAFDAFIYPPTTYALVPGSIAVPVPSYIGAAISYDTFSNPKFITNQGIWWLTSGLNDGFLVSDTFSLH